MQVKHGLYTGRREERKGKEGAMMIKRMGVPGQSEGFKSRAVGRKIGVL